MEETKVKFEEVPGSVSVRQAVDIAEKEFGIVVTHKKMVTWCEIHKCAKQPGGIGGKIYINPVELRRFLSDGKNVRQSTPRRKRKSDSATSGTPRRRTTQ